MSDALVIASAGVSWAGVCFWPVPAAQDDKLLHLLSSAGHLHADMPIVVCCVAHLLAARHDDHAAQVRCHTVALHCMAGSASHQASLRLASINLTAAYSLCALVTPAAASLPKVNDGVVPAAGAGCRSREAEGGGNDKMGVPRACSGGGTNGLPAAGAVVLCMSMP